MLRIVITPTGPAYRWGRFGTVYAFDPADKVAKIEAQRSAQAESRPALRAAARLSADALAVKDAAPSDRALTRRLERAVGAAMKPIIAAVNEAMADWLAARVVADAVEPALSRSEARVLASVLRVAARQAAQRVGLQLPDAALASLIETAKRTAAANARRRIVALGADKAKVAAMFPGAGPDILSLGADLSPLEQDAFRAWARDGLSYIRSVPEEAYRSLEDVLVPDFLAGRRPSTIQDKISERLEVEQRKAALIARDQIGKLNGSITEATQKQAGIEEYTWHATMDSRTREEHAHLNGHVFRWDDPPVSGTSGERLPPGKPINCRCAAIPVIPDHLLR